jgi:hypothetical protein
MGGCFLYQYVVPNRNEKRLGGFSTGMPSLLGTEKVSGFFYQYAVPNRDEKRVGGFLPACRPQSGRKTYAWFFYRYAVSNRDGKWAVVFSTNMPSLT